MVSRLRSRRMVPQQKLKQLHSLTKSKSKVRKISSAPVDAYHYLNDLKLILEATIQEYNILLDNILLPTEVKAERIGNDYKIKVTSKRGRNVLISILESFEEMGFNVLQARVSSTHCFSMEAIVEAQDTTLDVSTVTQNLLKAVGDQRQT